MLQSNLRVLLFVHGGGAQQSTATSPGRRRQRTVVRMRLRRTDRCRIWMPAERREIIFPLGAYPVERGAVNVAACSRTAEVLALQRQGTAGEAPCRPAIQSAASLVPSAHPGICLSPL